MLLSSKRYGYGHNSKINILLSIILINLLFSSVSANSIAPSNLADNQIFRRGNGEEIESLDPHKSTGTPSSNVILDLYEGLMTYDQNGKLILGQADKYIVSEDLKTYKFILRDNLKWSNGEKLVADDFVAGMRRTVDPKVGSIYSDILKPVQNAEKIISGELSTNKLGIVAKDSKTIVITLERPTPYFLELLTHATTLPIYQPNLKKYPDSFTLPGNSISNGPFKLSEWVVHSHITLEKNNHFRENEQVILDKVVFYPIQEQSVELKRYRADDIDYTNAIPDVQFPWIKGNLSDELYIAPQLATYYFGFNVAKEPFKDNKDLRKALSLAIDKNIIAEKVLRSGQIATDFFVPLNTNNYKDLNNDLASAPEAKPVFAVKNIEQQMNYKAKIELAKNLYKKAGYSKSNPAVIKILYNTQESHKSVAIAISAMWKKALDVKTELVNQEWKVFLRTRAERKETEFFREGWVGDYNDASTFLDLYSSNNPQNHSGYSNPEYDKLISKASLEKDLLKRSFILQQAEAILLEDAPIVPLYTYVSRHLVKSRVGGFAVNLLDRTYDRYIYIKKS